MKNLFSRLAPALLALCTLHSALSTAEAQGTAFTYQGLLDVSNSPASGSYDLEFQLYNAATTNGGTAVDAPLTMTNVAVSNGLFTVSLSFSNINFIGTNYWVEISATTNGGTNYSPLSPLIPITPAPYAISAGTASNLLGALPLAQLPAVVVTNNATNLILGGAFSGNGAGLTNLTLTNVWNLTGNAGITPGVNFLGTTDSNTLQFRVNGMQAFLLDGSFDSNRPNIIGGSGSNSVAAGVYGATIAGGYKNNMVDAPYGFIGGGSFNTMTNVTNAVIAGGQWNSIDTYDNDSAIVGGISNYIGANSIFSTIAGGYSNNIDNGQGSVIGGGSQNTIQDGIEYAAIPGGFSNLASGSYSFAAGQQAQAFHQGAFVWADSQAAPFASTNDDSFNVRAQGGVNFVTSGAGIMLDGQPLSTNGAIGASEGNTITSATNAFIGGGEGNNIETNANGSIIGGGYSNNIHTGSPDSTIAGGGGNSVQIFSTNSTVAGGDNNTIKPYSSETTIGGGGGNVIGTNSSDSTIAGGSFNLIGSNAPYAAIAGGSSNIVTGSYGTVPGGGNNIAGGQYSFAAGNQAQATNNGAFVWADSQNAGFASTNNDSFNVRAQGGVFFYVNAGGTAGAQLAANATSWTTLSDRNAKKNFQPVDPVGILNKLAAIPIQQWNYKWEKDGDVPNIGPMAQDFKAAFYPGRDDKGITTLEFDGVELAAIQGLNQKIEEQNSRMKTQASEMKEKDAEIESLKERLDKLERALGGLNAK
jgi:hypothetical protein